MRRALGLLSIVSFAGCGGNGLGVNGNLPDLATPAPDLTVTVVPDLAAPEVIDMAYYIPDADGVSCGNTLTCNIGQQCCVAMVMGQLMGSCMASCPDGGIALACDGPEDCNGNPCCAMFSIGGGRPAIGAVRCSDAPDGCQPSFQGGTGTGRLCHVDADCGDGGNLQLNTCCTVMYRGTTAHICLNPMFAGLVGGSCP